MKRIFKSKTKSKCVDLYFNQVKQGTAENVPEQFRKLTAIDVSLFLRENIKPEFSEKLSANILVSIFVSQEEAGFKPD